MSKRICDPKARRLVLLSSTDVIERELIVVRPKGECIDLPPYKDAYGKWRTETLFFETFEGSWYIKDKDGTLRVDRYTPIFTLREFPLLLNPSSPFYDRYKDHLIPSLRALYLQYNDPTEYKFSLEVFRSTYHWKHLTKVSWFKPYLEEWRLSLGEKLRQIGIEAIVRIAEGSDPKLGLQAAKWLAEEGFSQRRGKGRPSEAKINMEVKREVEIELLYKDDATRLGLTQTPPPEQPTEVVEAGSTLEQLEPKGNA